MRRCKWCFRPDPRPVRPAPTPGPNLSKRNLEHRTYPYLLRHVRPSRPNQVWGVAITYVRLKRYVLSWALDATLEMEFVLEAVDAALAKGPPEIWNSDHSSHFTSPCTRTA